MSRTARLLVATGAILLICVGSATAWVMTHREAPLLPPRITEQASFVMYVPGSDWQTDAEEATIRNGVLTLHASRGNDSLIITQQAIPEVFDDVPQYYPQLISRLNKYASFGTVNGTVYLTKPKELNGQQQAVLSNNGTLLFAHPSHNLDSDSWRRFFNSLIIVKPTD